ncbi:uncharacterized protein LOC129940134 [Eupeodes corollae]|uniref:uncharacterized protein LOC129940134 n=1 Tax=Eupeodes corollae TaxID=290404 RepID=UPI0024905DA7|nr:uncharacterized protein LOC129940134 [Eupeodes corollae]
MSRFEVDLPELHSDILEYLSQNSRIMSCLKLDTWNELTTLKNFQYFNYSREDLRREFLYTILPKIWTYNLTSIQQRKIEIFAQHNCFLITENGFKVPTQMENLPTEGIHFSTTKEDAQEQRLSCIIGDFVQLPTPDQKIKAWVSAVNSTDDELALCRILPQEELISRLIQSQKEFKTSGNFPPNLTPTIASKIIAYRTTSERLSSRIVPS